MELASTPSSSTPPRLFIEGQAAVMAAAAGMQPALRSTRAEPGWDALKIGVEYVVAGGEQAFTSTLTGKICDVDLKVYELWFANGHSVTDRSIGITRLHPLGG